VKLCEVCKLDVAGTNPAGDLEGHVHTFCGRAVLSFSSVLPGAVCDGTPGGGTAIRRGIERGDAGGRPGGKETQLSTDAKRLRVLLLLPLLASCADGGAPKKPALGDPVAAASTVTPGTIQVFTTPAPGGRMVTCVTWRSFDVGGISCDWANVK